jgi:glycerol uptake facilitator protein
MCYGEYFPNPGPLRKPNLTTDQQMPIGEFLQQVPHSTAFLAEMLGTAVLALAVFAMTDKRNASAPPPGLAPVFIGLTVAALISIIAPLTQACFNPARDFGPRLFASLAGWGEAAIPGPNGIGFFTVYIVAPTLGAVIGGGLYEKILRPMLPEPLPDE